MWTPEEPLLLETLDTDVDQRLSIYYQDETVEVSRYEVTFSPYFSDVFSAQTSAQLVEVFIHDMPLLFRPQFIEYLENGVLTRVFSWPDLPPGKDLVEFRPSEQSTITVSVTVEAYGTQTDDTGQETEFFTSRSWNVVLHHDYSSGKQKLEEYMHASSIPTG
ncbi:hypothetical protein LFR94_002357 [Vibrio vulnificus]|uniref:hypothetical protein n=1 Tax=Vibrio vulnificus TaxID=672 RepID=UPI001E0C98EC|nr:hypothetical protein [Vibrio vulnificus]EGQ7985329.1 hypothetical protein [Vibrio vulnificus]EGQ9237252.1 hypothetical protein [Vibrio vulnificus]EGR7960302.1 hypothetical protein [Vibrio vulnificus]EGR7983252.1 hypothetical protein [Vibrio vulnificus]